MGKDKRIPELDGLRGIAVLLVLFHHFDILPRIGWLNVLHNLFTLGWSGVDLFFTLSGFLITGILLEAKDQPNYFRNFYVRRSLRIFPIYFLFLIIFFHVIVPLAHSRGRWDDIAVSESAWYYSYLANWRIALVQPTRFLFHFWSLAIEEQFYLIWPLVIWLTPRRWLLPVCLSMACVSGLGRMVASNFFSPRLLYMGTPFRLETLALGACIAVQLKSAGIQTNRWIFPRAFWMGAGVFFGLVLFTRQTNHSARWMATFGFSLLAVVAASLVYHAVANSGSADRLPAMLRSRFLANFGKYSYAIYVLHFPLEEYLKPIYLGHAGFFHAGNPLLSTMLFQVVGIAASYGMGVLSWHIVEMPFLRLKDRFAGETRPARD